MSDGSASMEDMPGYARAVKRALAGTVRIKRANKMLNARNMVTIRPHDHNQDVVVIALTVDGYDLGRRYRNWVESTGLLFAHYKDHWIWLIVAATAGGIITKLLDRFATIIVAKHRL
jgi:hypothetical protein